MSATAVGRAPRVEHHALTMVRSALLVRLTTLGAAIVWEARNPPAPLTLAVLVGLSLVTFGILMMPRLVRTLAEHPLAVVVDSLLLFGGLALVGTASPLVLATLSTALIYGVLFPPALAAMLGAMLVALYLLTGRLAGDTGATFLATLGLPALYLSLLVLGLAARRSYRRQAELAESVAAARTAEAAADERGRLARELHDSLGKSLHGMALLAEGLPLLIDKDAARARHFATSLADGARQAAAETRQLVTLARADQPDRPLVQVLADMCRSWEEEHGVPCEFRYGCAVDLGTDARYELLAVVGEALENVARHADASHVTVELRGGEHGSIEIRVSDDGAGFMPREDAASPSGHFGLTGMHERAARMGAELTITSAPGAGTSVHVVCCAKGER